MNPALMKLLQQQRKAVESAPDVGALRDDWVAAVRALVGQISEWLSGAVEQKLLSLETLHREHAEDRLGRYKVPTLVITTPNGTKVFLEPYARLIVGGYGRVDLHSGARSAMLVRDSKGYWHFATRVGDRVKNEALTEATFSEALKDLLAA